MAHYIISTCIFCITIQIQESRIIAKMTGQCALYMNALKNVGESLATPMATFPETVNGLLLSSIV